MSKSESVPNMLQDALPYPLPVITPIWGASHSNLFTPFLESPVHTWVDHQQPRLLLLQPRLHTQKNLQILSLLMSTAAA